MPLHQEGFRKKAYDVLEKGLRTSDDPNVLRLELAAFASLDGAPLFGLDIIEKVPTGTPRYHVIKGNLLSGVGRWDQAANYWEKATEEDSQDVVPWFNLGYYLYNVKQDFPAAEMHYTKASRVFPEERRFRAYVGDALFHQGRVREALREY